MFWRSSEIFCPALGDLLVPHSMAMLGRNPGDFPIAPDDKIRGAEIFWEAAEIFWKAAEMNWNAPLIKWNAPQLVGADVAILWNARRTHW